MLALGVNLKNSRKKLSEELKQAMVGPVCPFCVTPNIPGTQLCVNCHKPIASNAMDAVMKEAEQSKREIEEVKKRMESMESNFNRNFQLLISLGTLDHAVANNNNATPTSNPTWNEIIQERRRELKEAEKKRIKELVDKTPEWAEPFLEMVETQQQPTKEEEVKSKSK